MTSDKPRAQQLAESPEFAAVLQDGSTLKAKAKKLRASTKTIREAARILGYEMQSQEDLNRAPTDAEDEASLSSLALAPSVAELAIIVRENALAAYAAEVRSPYARTP